MGLLKWKNDVGRGTERKALSRGRSISGMVLDGVEYEGNSKFRKFGILIREDWLPWHRNVDSDFFASASAYSYNLGHYVRVLNLGSKIRSYS
jgi:hypothetical protein